LQSGLKPENHKLLVWNVSEVTLREEAVKEETLKEGGKKKG
jgi:hypothetical protein